MLKKVGYMMVTVYCRLRGTSKVEKVGEFEDIDEADDVIAANQDTTGGWLYFRDLTEDERNELSE